MLILSRAIGQRIVIGEGPNAITITLVGFNRDGNQVRFGIDAPRSVLVDREEKRPAESGVKRVVEG